MKCWKCEQFIEDSKGNRLAFRATCDHFNAWLHCCVNCQHYQIGLSNNCKIPGTEQIADRESCNFCEDFTLRKPTSPKTSKSLSDISKNLFGEEIDPVKKSFEDFFDD